MVCQDNINKAVYLAIKFGTIDGAHHKMWIIDQILRILLQDKYEAVIKSVYDGEDYVWDTGTPI